MALAHMRGAGKTLMDTGLLVQRGSAMSVVAEEDLDDTPTSVIAHPITGQHGHLGTAAWHDEHASARRRVYALDMGAAARRVVTRLDARSDETRCRTSTVRCWISGRRGCRSEWRVSGSGSPAV